MTEEPKKGHPVAWTFIVLLFIGGCVNALSGGTSSKGTSSGGSRPLYGTIDCDVAMRKVAQKYPGQVSDYSQSERMDILREMDAACDRSSVTSRTTTKPYTPR